MLQRKCCSTTTVGQKQRNGSNWAAQAPRRTVHRQQLLLTKARRAAVVHHQNVEAQSCEEEDISAVCTARARMGAPVNEHSQTRGRGTLRGRPEADQPVALGFQVVQRKRQHVQLQLLDSL